MVLLSLTPHLVLRTVTVSQTENRAEIVNFNESQTAMVTNLMIMSNKIYNFICFFKIELQVAKITRIVKPKKNLQITKNMYIFQVKVSIENNKFLNTISVPYCIIE